MITGEHHIFFHHEQRLIGIHRLIGASNFKFDSSYDGGFFIGSGNDILEIEISPDSNIETILTFISDNFSIDPPTTSKLTCLPSIKIGDISFSNFWLDLLVAPFLADTIEPYLEPTICEPLVTVESILSDSVLMISDVLDGLADPISPELTDKLAPEMKLFHDYSKPIYVDFVSMQPIVDLVSDIIEILVNSISDTISEDDGPISIPLNLTLDENMGIDLHEIRIIGLNNFTFDPLSLVGNYTLSTTYELDYIGLEVELGIRNADGGKDIMMMKLGVNDVVSDFALLLVIEQSIFEAIEEIFPIVDAIMNLNITDVDYDAIASSLTDAAMEIISSVNITDLITDIGNIEDISQVMDIIADVLSQLDINEIISKIDFSAFAGLIEIFQELMEQLQNFDIFGVLNHVANSIYAIEIASFSLTSSSFDALEISGLTQFIGLQLMFNEVSEAVFSMYDASLINVVDFFLQSTTRGFINAVIGESFVNDSCLDEFLGSIVYFPHDDACAKLELYDGGELSLDYSNPSCSQHLFSGEQLSVFNKSTENVAYFMGDSQWEVEFVEDFSVPELQVVSGMDNVTETWHVTLTYPSCTQSFTVNTSTPTDPPTVVPTVVPTVNATQNVTEKNNTGGVTGTYTNAGRSLLETVLNFFYPRQKDDELEWQRW